LLRDRSFLLRIVASCRDAGLGAIYAVGSPDDPRIEAACAELGARLVLNVDPARGMSSSVHAGLLEVVRGAATSGVVIFPVDLPLVRADTVGLVAHAAVARPDAWARPLFEGASGHPVALGARLVPRILDAGPSVPLRDALRAIDAPGLDVACDDPGVVADVDDREDLARARAVAT
jgi:molybdenum cofactor cytidylyltransferase